jgi:hypothetical protein
LGGPDGQLLRRSTAIDTHDIILGAQKKEKEILLKIDLTGLYHQGISVFSL